MVEKEDREFADWSTRGLGAPVWLDVELRLRFTGSMSRVHEEMMARGASRVCLVCEFPDIVAIHSTEFGENRALITFCSDHVGNGLPPDLWDGRQEVQGERVALAQAPVQGRSTRRSPSLSTTVRRSTSERP
jgi:hypothetical protein